MPVAPEKSYENLQRRLLEEQLITDEQFNQLMVLAECYASFHEARGAEREQAYREVATKLINSLIENVFMKGRVHFFTEEILQRIHGIPALKEKALGSLTAENVVGSDLLQHGAIGKTDDGYLTTGFSKKLPRHPSLPTGLTGTIGNLTSVADSPETRRAMIMHQARIYNTTPVETNFVDMSFEERDDLFLFFKEVIAEIRRHYREHILPLQDAIMFYNQCMTLYHSSGGQINIFSTTPGLLIPEEYSGDPTQMKSEHRKKYFDYGIGSKKSSNLKKYYQWDSIRAATKLWDNYQKSGRDQEYKEKATAILADFFMMDNLEISEAPFTEAQWKIMFTLVTDSMLVFSERGEKKHINEGIMLDNKILKSNRDAYRDLTGLIDPDSKELIKAIRETYKKGSCKVLKDLNEVYENRKYAMERARDIVEILLERGKLLRKEKVTLAPEPEKPRISKTYLPQYELFMPGKRIVADREEIDKQRQHKKHYDLWIDKPRDEFIFEGQSIELSKREMNLLIEIIIRHGEIVTWEYLEKHVWDSSVGTNTYQQTKKNIIKKVRKLAPYIKGDGGYRLTDDFPYNYCIIRLLSTKNLS